MLMPSSLAILGSTFTGEERGRAVGTWAAVGAAAGALGPLLGGWLVDAAGWRAIFLINLPIAAAAIGIAAWAVEESGSAERPKPDWTGGMLATTGLAALTWGLTEASAKGGAGASSAVAMAAGVMLLAAFVLVERRRGDRAMVPLTLFGSRGFTGLTLLTFLLYGALGVLMVVLPYVLIEAGGYTALEAGAALLPLPTIIALASPWLGRAAARLGPRLPLSVGPALVAGGFLLAAALGIGGSYWQSVFPAVLLVAIGMAAAVAPLTSAVLASVDAGHQGTASGLNSAVARTGGLIATALLGFVFAEQVQALVGSFRAAALAGAAVCVLASLSGFLLLERRSVAAV
jgi:MFS family permease